MSSRSSSKLSSRNEPETEDVEIIDGGPEGAPRRIRLSRISPEERERLEQELFQPGAEYVEESWHKQASEDIPTIQRKVDAITGRAESSRTRRSRSTPATRDLPPGLRSRISEALGPVTDVRLVYATKEHMVCRVRIREQGTTRRTVVLVGPDKVQEVSSVLAAIDALTGHTPATETEIDEVVAEAEPEQAPVTSEPGPFGDVHPVEDLEGIGETYGEGLAAMGIEDTQQLWQADPSEVAERLDISEKVTRRWKAQAELMALDGIGPQYAELLARVGVMSIEDLAEADAGELVERIHAKDEELMVSIQKNVIGKARVTTWIQAAKDHDPDEVIRREA